MSFRLSLRSVDPQFQPHIFFISSAALHPRNHGPAGIIVGTGTFQFLNQVTLATEIQGDPRGGHLLGMGIDGSKYDWLDHMFQYVPIKTWWGVVGVPVSFEEPVLSLEENGTENLPKSMVPMILINFWSLPKSVPQNHESLLVESPWPHWNRSISRDWS